MQELFRYYFGNIIIRRLGTGLRYLWLRFVRHRNVSYHNLYEGSKSKKATVLSHFENDMSNRAWGCAFILILLAIMVILCNCTFENRKATTQMCFKDFDKHLQDTLINLPVDSFGCYPDLIDLTGHYTLTRKEIGPWCCARKLENLETGKSYWLNYNTPIPIIVTSKEIIFSVEYNIITLGVEQTDKFNVINIAAQ